DACVLLATGQGEVSLSDKADPDYQAFTDLVLEVCQALAWAIVRDGEGATKFITVRVEGGRDREECRRVAFTVAHSPLVKTAFFASDPNWGRILAAVGRAKVADLDLTAVAIHLDEVPIVRDGGRDPAYTEEQGQRVMQRKEITVGIELGRGEAAARVWTCDLSYDYVRINADYRT
ncbi:MAG: bifunctional ornithine acetyltransferase/N-acetylglutamate synthase, partial [Candidatus Competibacteraceae bacterium]|nr:bifunctional ornithine acetyltransferase/N-acetylglutamate synthase [Candidatus Competibacteraceae bacterium]